MTANRGKTGPSFIPRRTSACAREPRNRRGLKRKRDESKRLIEPRGVRLDVSLHHTHESVVRCPTKVVGRGREDSGISQNLCVDGTGTFSRCKRSSQTREAGASNAEDYCFLLIL